MELLSLYKADSDGHFVRFVLSELLPQFEEYVVGIRILSKQIGPDVMIVQNQSDGNILLFENLCQDCGHLLVFGDDPKKSDMCIDLLRKEDLVEKLIPGIRKMIAREAIILPVSFSLEETYGAAAKICRYIKIIRKLDPESYDSEKQKL